MASKKQVQMVMRDMLFITWAVDPAVVRKLVDGRLDLDTWTTEDREIGLVSAVCFHVTELRSSVLAVPSLSFHQINYRTYVKSGPVPGVFFFDMKVNSRMLTALTGFLNVPVYYEEIEISTASGTADELGYRIKSDGLRAEAMIDLSDGLADPASDIPHQFITNRLVGYAGVGNATYRIDVEQRGLESVSARIQNVNVPSLERLGLVSAEQALKPVSVLYVREALFGADTPVREW
jgi:uncharacterized protein YqjF (DUF2071 family)